MAFDPDSYLQSKKGFNPDAYLNSSKEFNPDEYLKRDTTFGENFQIGLGNAASTVVKGVGLPAGWAASLVDEDLSDSLFQGTEETAKKTQDYWIPKDAKQTFGGKVASVLSTVPAQLMAMPFSPADTGMNMVRSGETANTAQTGVLLDTLGNEAGVMIPGAVGGRVATKAATGAAMGGAQDAAVRQAITSLSEQKETKEMFKPTWETTGIASAVGGVLGPLTPNNVNRPKEATPTKEAYNIVDPDFRAKLGEASTGEVKILRQISDESMLDINEANSKLAEIEQIIHDNLGDVPSDLTEKFDIFLDELKGLVTSKVKLDNELIGKINDPDVVAQRVSEILRDLKKEREPEAPPSVEPLRSPHEIAQEKLGEASNEHPEQVSKRLYDAQEKLDGLDLDNLGKEDVPGSEYRSLREALETEIEGYKKLLGETHDSIADTAQKVERISTKENPTREVLRDTLGHISTFGDAFEKIKQAGYGTGAQRTLFEILNKIPWVKETRILFSDIKMPSDNGGFVSGRYHREGNYVRMFDDLGRTPPVRVLLHELVHAATVHLLKDPNSKWAKSLNVMYETFKKVKGNEINPETGRPMYGFRNVQEFVAEAFTRPEFQKVLKGIQSMSEVTHRMDSLWNQFKDFVKTSLEIFDPRVRSALDDVLEHGYALMGEAAETPVSVFHKMSENMKKAETADSVAEISAKAINDLTSGVKRVGIEVFNKNNIAQFFKNHPRVKLAHEYINKAEASAEAAVNRVWHKTDIPGLGKSFLTFFKKMSADDSLHTILHAASNMDAYEVLQVLQKGFREKDFAETLAKFGDHLTPEQVKLFNAVAESENIKFSLTEALQNKLEKKNVTPYVKGHYPAARKGQYYVTVGYGELLAKVQYFETKVQAERYREKYGKLVHLEVSDVMDNNSPRPETNAKMVDIFTQALKQKTAANLSKQRDNVKQLYRKKEALEKQIVDLHENGIFDYDLEMQLQAEIDAIKKEIPPAMKMKKAAEDYFHNFNAIIDVTGEAIISRMQDRGGKMGHTQEFRSNIEGYMGTEMFKTPEELGHSFKNGIIASMNDFGANYKSLQIKTDVEPFITDLKFKERDAIGHAAIEQMFNNALGRNKDFIKPVTDVMNHTVDKWARHIVEQWIGKGYERDKGIGKSTYEGLTTLFYMTKMLPKFAFSVLGQILSVPQVIRVASKDGQGVRAWASFAEGLGKLAARDDTLYNALKWESQRYNTFEPGIVEQFDLYRKDQSKTMEGIKDWVLLQAPAKGMDSFSRIASWSILYTHYKRLGLSEAEASAKARLGTGEAQNLYGQNNMPAIFKHMGAAGDMIRPLQSFAQNYLGNLISDVQTFKAKDWNTWGPLVNFTIANIAVGGVMSLPFIQDYEYYRKIINKKFGDYTLPSILDLFARDNSFLDRVEPASETARNAIIYGTLPALLNTDIAASVRANESYMTVVAGVLAGDKKYADLAPIVGNAEDVAVGMMGVGKSLVKDVPIGERKKNLAAALPVGHLGYIGQEIQGNNVTNLGGQRTNQKSVGSEGVDGGERRPVDIINGLLGTTAIDQKKMQQQTREDVEHEKLRSAQLKHLAALAVETGNGDKYIQKMAQIKYVSAQEIIGALESAGFKRIVPMEIAQIVNEKGQVSKGLKTRNAIRQSQR